jgi:hypothetical protein
MMLFMASAASNVVPTAGLAQDSICVGDCNDDDKVTIEEIVTMVSLALGVTVPTNCDEGDRDGNSSITIDEIIAAVTNALNGCTVLLPTPMPTATMCQMASSPSAAAVGGRIFVAVVGSDNHIYTSQGQPPLGFGPWTRDGFMTDAPVALTAVGDNLYYFAKSLDDRIFSRRVEPSGSKSEWREVDGEGGTDVAPAAGALGSRVFVAIKGFDSFVYFNEALLGEPFMGWQRVAPCSGPLCLNFATDTPVAVAAANDSLGSIVFVFARSLVDSRLFGAGFAAGDFGWSEIEGGVTFNAPAAVVVENQEVVIALNGIDGGIYMNHAEVRGSFSEVTWREQYLGTETLSTDSTLALTAVEDDVYVFAKTLSNAILYGRAKVGGGINVWRYIPFECP